MTELLEYSPKWCELSDLLRNRKSAVVISPRNYGKWAVLEKYAKNYAADPSLKCVCVSSRIPFSDGDIDYSWLWNAVRGQLGTKSRLSVKTVSSFLGAMEASLFASDVHLLVFIGGAGRGHEESHYRVVSAFQRLLGTGRLSIVVTDDYSSFYFQKQNFLLSDLHSLILVQVGPTTTRSIADYLEQIPKDRRPSSGYIAETAERVFSKTGGHIGLAQEFLRSLERSRWPVFGVDWDRVINSSLEGSVVLEHITRALEEDSRGYSQTALEYRTPAIPEQNSPRIHILRQLGVLQRAEPPRLQLCGGAIATIIASLAQEKRGGNAGRLGTVVSEAGPRLFEEGPVELTDDDLVILHLSDLHVGENYRYRLTWKGGQFNPNEQSAAELLREDLQALGVLNKVDGMVLTGDFVWKGTPEEFRRALTVVQELVTTVGIDLTSVVLIPGNHDVEWNPGTLASRSYGKAVSRESYDDFVQLLGKELNGEVEEARIISRSGKFGLHIVGLDSNRVEGPNAAGIGFVSRDGLLAARKTIANFETEFPTINAYRWVAVHHHVFPATSSPLADAEGAKVSTMANSAEILEYVNQWKAEIVLHGHEHQPCVTVARRWPVDVGDVFTPIASIGAGSFGVKRDYLGPFSRNQYFMLIRRPNGVLIRSRCQGSSGIKFVGHSDLWLPR